MLTDPMKRRHLVTAIAALAMALLALDLWVQTPDSGTQKSSTSSASQEASASLIALVRRGLAEDEVSLSKQWQRFSGVEPVAGGVPQPIRIKVVEALGGRLGREALDLDFGSARRERTPSGMTLWVVPGPGVMCMIREKQVAITCSSVQEAIRRGLLLQTRRTTSTADEADYATIGVVPDWANEISLRAGGAPVTLPIRSNAFDFAATRPIKVLRLTR
jgi:hypothetical protein